MTTTPQAPRNTIFNGDCIDVMQAFDTGSIDFILTDPPYVSIGVQKGPPIGVQSRKVTSAW